MGFTTLFWSEAEEESPRTRAVAERQGDGAGVSGNLSGRNRLEPMVTGAG